MDCPPAADDIFGPAVHGCRDDFDFTLLFEQSFFQIAPCALLLLLLPVRAYQLKRKNVKTLGTGMRTLKQTAIVSLAATQLALLVVWSLTPTYRTKASVPAATLSFLASVALLFLSSAEHTRSVRPSSLINTYMLFSLVLDIPQTRTLWLRSGLPRSVPALFTAGLAAKTLILCLEARTKRRALFPPYKIYAPEALVSLYDRTTLWWINPLFLEGYKGLISFEKLYPIDQDLSSQQVEDDFQSRWGQTSKNGKHSLLWVIARSVRWTLAALLVPRLFMSALVLAQALLINGVTAWLSAEQTPHSTHQGYGLVVATACLYLGLAVSRALTNRQQHRLRTKVRGIVMSAVHTKILTLPGDQLADNAALTHATTDVSRLDVALSRLDEALTSPLEVGAATFLLERQIGVSCVAPLAWTIIITALSLLNSNMALPLQKRWLAAVQVRISYTAAVLGCPKGFKMLGLTDCLTQKIQALRVQELIKNADYRKYVTHRNTFSAVPQAFAPPLALMMFTLIHGGQALTPTVAFTALSLIALLTQPIHELIHAIPLFQQAVASFDRVQAFLLLPETDGNDSAPFVDNNGVSQTGTDAELSVLPSEPFAAHSRAMVVATDLCVRLGKEHRVILQDIKFALSAGSLNLVVGAVGSGKSMLLKAVIGDVRATSGQLWRAAAGKEAAYCAQDPWLPNGAIRNIILGESDMDQLWYRRVVQACALHVDLTTFQHGDETVIGTRGISLSGGQRQRLALARALYARKALMLVDDALGGLDASTSRHVFDDCFGINGICRDQGMTVLLATHAVQYLGQADHIIALTHDGAIAEQGSFADLQQHKGYVYELYLKGGQTGSSDRTAAPADDIIPAKPSPSADDAQQDLARRTGDMAVYGYYARSLGWEYGTVVVITAATFAFGVKFPDLWAQWWSQSHTGGRLQLPLSVWIIVYMLLAATGVISVFVHIYTMLVKTVPKSSAQLHQQLLHAVMRAPYSFFVDTDSGVTLNRFANDMSVIEGELAGAVMQTLDGLALFIGGAILIAAGAEYVGVAMPAVLFVLYCLQRFYLRTSRQLRFMDLEAQAPLLTFISEALAGVTTIRSFGWQSANHAKCQSLLDASQRPFYLMLCIQRWLNLVLDLVTAALATIVVSLAITLRNTSSAGSIGVSLLNVLSFNQNLAYLITAWTSLETCLGAVARCKNFESSTTPEDKPEEDQTPPVTWPQRGALVYANVSASYSSNGETVLDDLTFSISAGEKVGICGRSGSGKSSLLLTLLRLLDNSSGTITLDDMDLSTIPRQTIRSRLTALPQEAITVPGTLRDNIDPLQLASDSAAEAALARVGLLDLVNQQGGLDASMTELSLSHGQLQLFAVARALLRKSKLLILDEMTGSVDTVTEELMMSIIKEEFRESTVIAVAHRLRTIGDFDRIIVLDKGRVVEMGKPGELLEREGGWFREMWERSGH
ncbi:hypothetical protein BAUCODRAFT_39613 [Baudoinia panamericana UAMH 10762]|uniref:ABC transporter n=1 Tax=Baudoinia panamericana (strain UAMH 10762) TaxID=717646 RepID=M2MJH2_BAUPA|nr:uncharacterized protein BAUCODRAFT_39613 [Baudoinia panamericana UAMH 10762]EMC91438.1 hypothetical protein BAUCODRAFT_39613 [Baudoinia panamericana UAMH 10762]